MSDFDVIVVGAGYGGVTTAALLAREGRRVLLIDKNDRAGGKAMTIRRRGYGYEMWPVLSLPADDSRFHELVATLGIEGEAPLIVPEGDAVDLRYLAADGTWRGYVGPSKQADDPLAVENLEATFGVGPEDVEAMVEMTAAVLTLGDDDVDALDDTGMLAWLRGYGLADPVIAYLASMLNLVFVAPVDRIPASEGVRTMRQLFLGGGGRYHAGGYGRVAEACADHLVGHGGTFLTRTRVERILVEDGRAAGVDTAAGTFRAPVVVSNAGIQPTVLKLAGEEHFPAEYAQRVAGLEPGWGMVGVRYFLDAPVFRTGMTMVFSDQSWWDTERYEAAHRGEWPDVPLVFVAVPNLYDPSLAPEGHQVALVGILGDADPRAVAFNEEAIARAEAALADVFPDLPARVERREAYSAHHVSNLTRDAAVPGAGGECIGLAQVIGQCGRSKPEAATPLPGLYLTGTDAGGYGCGTHQAVDSGFTVAAAVLAELDARQPT
ncbi:MAG: NAD(P)/FAD-dependent oxidoreductase [Acidimicrobiia bacterium]|nr:NAD(P)/FAD-dependent oxidoreductase [Acidimicrobiia bacterium]